MFFKTRRLVVCIHCGHEIATKKPEGEGIQCAKCLRYTFGVKPKNPKRKKIRCQCGYDSFTTKDGVAFCPNCKKYHANIKDKSKAIQDNT